MTPGSEAPHIGCLELVNSKLLCYTEMRGISPAPQRPIAIKRAHSFARSPTTESDILYVQGRFMTRHRGRPGRVTLLIVLIYM